MQKKTFINDLPVLVSNMVLCSLLNISKQNFQQWQQHQSFPKNVKVRHGFYDLQKVIEFRDTYIYGDAEIAKAMQKERLKYQTARSERERLEMEEIKGQLVRREDYNHRLAEVAVTTKDALLLWAKTLPPEMGLKPEDQKRIMKILDKKTRQILTVMAQGLAAVKKYTNDLSLQKMR
jgi:hypothetical protein